MKTANQSAASDLINDLAEQASNSAREVFGVSEEQAHAHGTDVAMRIVEQWGGQQLYMPKGIRVEASKLHLEVYEAWTGRNHRDLARRFNLSLQFVYRIVKVMRKADLTRRQGDMFSPVMKD